MGQKERLDIFDGIVLSVLVTMIVLAPVAMGSVAPWAKNTLFVLSLVMILVWFLQAARRGKIVLVRDPVFMLIGLFVLVVCAQLVPLPQGILETISPATAEVYETTLPGAADSGAARTLSLTPYHTSWELRRIVTVFLVFLVIVNTFRTRFQVLAVIAAMIAVGAFEAIYGFVEYVGGGKSIFWNEMTVSRNAVSGTFINKNHFAGLLEMVVPVTVGLCMALAPRSIRGGSFKVKALETMSSKRVHHQALLGILVVVMTIAIFFSLSRAGTSAAVGAWIPFFLFLGMTSGSRKYTLAVLLLIVAILCLFLGGDTDEVVDRMGEVASGESLSWEARLDLWESSLTMIGDYPIFGTGLGTFKEAFERYQSSHFGDKSAAFAHNDWIQVICETGVIGGLIAIAGILFVFVALTRKTLARRDIFCRWIATGALAACLAMLIHSFFDFNLYKVTSNSLVFAAVIGIWYAAVNMPGKSRHSHSKNRTVTVPLGAAPVRCVLALIVIALVGVLAIQPVRSAVADIELNRYLAATDTKLEQPRLYHFLPMDEDAKIEPAQVLEKARDLDGRNPLLVYLGAIQSVREANDLVRAQARTVAAGLAPAGDGYEVDLSALEEAIYKQLAAEMTTERKPFLEKAERIVREAIAMAPSKSAYHLLLAEIVSEIGEPIEGATTAADEASISLWLAPGKPRTLFVAGKVALLDGIDRDALPVAAPKGRKGLDYLKRCLSIEPDYRERIYTLVGETFEGIKPLFAVTPDTIDDNLELSRVLEERMEWDSTIESLDRTWELCNQPRDDQALSESELLDIKISIANRKASILGILGRFDERNDEVRIYRTLTRQRDDVKVQKAKTLRGSGKYGEAFRRIREILKEDWANPEALVVAADLARRPVVKDEYPLESYPLDHLLRLILLNDSVRPDVADSAREVLARIEPYSESERRHHALVGGGLSVLNGEKDEGIALLEESLQSDGADWKNEHLTWYFLGRGYEARGQLNEARDAYRKVIEKVPTHRGACERLSKLDADFGSAGVVEPEQVTDIDFGGKASLYGYRIDAEAGGDDGESESMGVTLCWELSDTMAESCHIRLQLLDEDMEPLASHHSTISAMKAKLQANPVCYSGQIVEERVDLAGLNGSVEYLRIRIQPPSSNLLLADNGEMATRLKVVR